MAKEVQNTRSGEIKKTAEDLDEFLNRVRISNNILCVYFSYLFQLLMFDLTNTRLYNDAG